MEGVNNDFDLRSRRYDEGAEQILSSGVQQSSEARNARKYASSRPCAPGTSYMGGARLRGLFSGRPGKSFNGSAALAVWSRVSLARDDAEPLEATTGLTKRTLRRWWSSFPGPSRTCTFPLNVCLGFEIIDGRVRLRARAKETVAATWASRIASAGLMCSRSRTALRIDAADLLRERLEPDREVLRRSMSAASRSRHDAGTVGRSES